MPALLRHLRIHGVVQGVGFRQGLRSEAKSLGITGWVRNRSDGSVEALLRGDRERVEALIRWAQRGPRGARVDRVDIAEGRADTGSADTNEAGTDGDFLCHPTL